MIQKMLTVMGVLIFAVAVPRAVRADLQPSQLLSAYGFNTAQATYTGAGQTIAIYTDSYYSGLQADVDAFSAAYMNGNTTTVVATTTSGTAPTASTTANSELSLDVQYAHLIAPAATILVVDGSSISSAAVYAAEHGASVYSTSYSSFESSVSSSSIARADARYQTVAGMHVVALAAAGDGSEVNYPASSPYVVGVAGSNPTVNSSGAYTGESAWSSSGGGLSAVELEPSYQLGVQTSGFRSTPDVSIAGGDTSAVPVYVNGAVTDYYYGSSLATPIWAGLIALVDQARALHGLTTLGTTQLLTSLYATVSNGEYSSVFHDITSGSDPTSGLSAGSGYDELTGLGSPQVVAMINYLSTVDAPEPGPAMVGLMLLPLLLRPKRSVRRLMTCDR